MLADLEVVGLDALLRGGDRPGHELVLDRLTLLHPEALHDPLHALRTEDPQQVILERQVETRGAGVALSSGASAELVVHAPRLMALRADDVQPATLAHPGGPGPGDPSGVGKGARPVGRPRSHGVQPLFARI